jgi:hypothetical protein
MTSFKETIKNISQDMVDAVVWAMQEAVQERGDLNKMVTIEKVEQVLLTNPKVQFFIPVSLVLNDLAFKGYMREFQSEKGKLFYGLNRTMQKEMTDAKKGAQTTNG